MDLRYGKDMVIRLTSDQYGVLFMWGRSHGLSTADEAAKLLLDMLLEVRGYPDMAQTQARGEYQPKGFQGPRAYTRSVKITPFARSPGTKALWLWGVQQGEPSISSSFRALVDLLEQVWAKSKSLDDNLATLVHSLGSTNRQVA